MIPMHQAEKKGDTAETCECKAEAAPTFEILYS